MSVGHTKNYDQQFEVTIELSRGEKPREMLRKTITKHIVDVLKKVNSEYAKLYATIGERAAPSVTLVRYGEIHTVPGRKHKWITRK